MDFTTAEERFYALMGRLAAGVISQAEFQTRLEELIVQDEQGRTWMIGAQSGKWYRYDGKRWVHDTPPQTGRVSPTADTIIAPVPPGPLSERDIHPAAGTGCPRCGHALIAGATFCDRCGLRLPAEDAAPLVRRAAGPPDGKTAPPPPAVAREPFTVPPPPPPPPASALTPPAGRPAWLNVLALVLVGLVALCCLGAAATALFWPNSPVSLLSLLGGPAVAPTPEPTQTPTYVTPTFTVGPAAATSLPTIQPSGPTATATVPPPTRVRTATAVPPTPPPLPTVTRAPTQTPAPTATAAGLRFRVKDGYPRLIEQKFGLGFIKVAVLDKNGQGLVGIKVRIDGGDPATWQLEEITDSKGSCEFHALSSNKYNVSLPDYGAIAPWIDRTDKNWEVVFEAY